MSTANVPKDANEATGVPGLDGVEIVAISCGDYHAAAIDTDGNLYTWGGGKTTQYNKGQCGHGNTEFIEVAKRVEELSHKRVTKISCGGFHTLVLTEDKILYTMGAGEFGECGAGDQKNKLIPTKIDIPKPNKKKNPNEPFDPELDLCKIIDIAAGTKHSIALSGNGDLFTFGYGDNGQLGHKNTDNQKKPAYVVDFKGVRVSKISAGNFHSVVQTEKGDLYATGLNKDGQLALGTPKSSTKFTYISCFAGINIQKFEAGGNHTLFMIDEFMPFKTKFEVPAPLGVQPTKSPLTTKK